MERRKMVAVRAGARCLPSTPMGRVLRTCIISRPPLDLQEAVMVPTATELILLMDYFYRATRCMGRRNVAAVRAGARCLPSTPMARVLRFCTLSRQPLDLQAAMVSTRTELIRLAD